MTSDHPLCPRCNDRLTLKNSPYCRWCAADVGAGGPLALEGGRFCTKCKVRFYPRESTKFKRCGSCRREKAAEMRQRYRDGYRQRRIDKTFSYRPGEFEAKLAEQGSRCANCGVGFADLADVENMLTARVPVPYNDHDHRCCDHRASMTHPTCGKCNRGLVCLRCNVLLGYADDSIELLERTIAYLKFWREVYALQAVSI
jgi:hypothetical protein